MDQSLTGIVRVDAVGAEVGEQGALFEERAAKVDKEASRFRSEPFDRKRVFLLIAIDRVRVAEPQQNVFLGQPVARDPVEVALRGDRRERGEHRLHMMCAQRFDHAAQRFRKDRQRRVRLVFVERMRRDLRPAKVRVVAAVLQKHRGGRLALFELAVQKQLAFLDRTAEAGTIVEDPVMAFRNGFQPDIVRCAVARRAREHAHALQDRVAENGNDTFFLHLRPPYDAIRSCNKTILPL